MSTTADESNVYRKLRDKAEAQLETGTASATSHWSLGVDALRLLHRLSSDPDSAEDALKLLHELQVHQVELDLQNEEIAGNERALVEELRLYRELYDSAPIGYFVVNLQGSVIQGNPAGAELLGVAQNDLAGQRIDTLLAPEKRPQLLDLLEQVAGSGVRGSCMAEAGGDANTPRQLHFLASSSRRSGYVLLACCENARAGEPD